MDTVPSEPAEAKVLYLCADQRPSICGSSCEHSRWVECECVDGPDVINVVDGLAVALEGILLLLHLRTWVEVLDGNSPFHGSCRVACNMRQDCAPLEIKITLVPCPSVIHAKARVMNFRLLSRVCAGVFIFLMS